MSLLNDIHQLVELVPTLSDLKMRSLVIDRYLKSKDVDDAAWSLGQILRLALREESGSSEVVSATCHLLLDYHTATSAEIAIKKQFAPESYLSKIEKSAINQGLTGVRLWVSRAGPEKRLAVGAKLPPIHVSPTGHALTQREAQVEKASGRTDVTVGHRRALARRRDPKLVQRLLLDPDPLVLRSLLNNRALRLEDVIVVASRRPTTPELLMEVTNAKSWLAYEGVREALVLNPYGETQVALSLLPSLMSTTRMRVKNSQELHFLVGRFCAFLHDLEKVLKEEK